MAAEENRSVGVSFWERYEGPTWVVATTVYGCWGLIVSRASSVVAYGSVGCGRDRLAQLLQHETIHALVRVPRKLRFALGFPPLGLAIPYQVYCRNHRKHHRDAWLTDPVEDPESFYHREEAWRSYPRAVRALYILTQTLFGRLTIGPLIYLCGFLKREIVRLVARDRSNLSAWTWHAFSVTLLVLLVQLAGMPFWQYALLVVYPGLGLGMLRSFFEHHYAARPAHRTAIVESGFPLNLLF